MCLKSFLLILPLFAAVAVAQETNFTVGPQYLTTYGSPLTLHAIATPSLSLGEAHPFVEGVGASQSLAATIPSASAPSDTFLGGVYWGKHKDSEIIARRLETPSMAVSDTAAYMNAVANQVAGVQPASSEETAPTPSGSIVIELAGTSIPSNLPASMFDSGVAGVTNAQSLTVRGYGIPLGDVAAYWKSHKRQAPRIFSNADVHPH